MKKTKLLCMSVMALSLSACGPDVDLPGNYVAVDKQNKEEVLKFETKIAEDLLETINKSANGCTEKASLKFDKISETILEKASENEKKYKVAQSVTLTDFNFEITSKYIGNNIFGSDYKAVVDIENFGFKMVLQEEPLVKELKISDVDLSFTLYNGDLYMDLSDKDFENALISTFEVISDQDELDEKLTKTLKAMLCGKFYVPNFAKEVGLPELKMGNASLTDALEIVEEFTEYLLTNRNSDLGSIADKITLADYPNSKAAGISFVHDGLTNEEKEAIKPNRNDSKGKMALYFNKDGLFESLGIDFDVLIENYIRSVICERIEIKNLECSFEADYGKVNVKEPNKNDFGEFGGSYLIEDLLKNI